MFGTKSFPGVGYPTPVSIPSELSCRQVSVPSSTEWQALLMGLMSVLADEKSWSQRPGGISAEDAAAEWADVIERMYASAESLGAACGAALPYQTRLNDGVVETSPDGVTWTPNPYADPRNQRLYPKVTTGTDPCCDASARVVAFMEEWVDQTVTALTLGADFFALAGLLGELVAPFMPEWYVIFDLFITVAGGLASAGASAISASFNSTVYDDIMCYLYCNCADGEWDDSGRGDVEQAITDNQSTIVALVANGVLELTGTAGMNNLAGGRNETGDCTSCPGCTWCYTFDFTAGNQGFDGVTDACGVYETTGRSSLGWLSKDFLCSSYNRQVSVQMLDDFDAVVTQIVMEYDRTAGSYSASGPACGIFDQSGFLILQNNTVVTNGSAVTLTWTGSKRMFNVGGYVRSSRWGSAVYSGVARIRKITLRGTGDNPFGVDNCT